MSKNWKIAGINFDHFHMGDLLRMAHEHPNAEIVGLSDEQPGRMKEAINDFGIVDTQVFDDCRQCLESTKPDLVILCPSTGGHAEWTEKIAPYPKVTNCSSALRWRRATSRTRCRSINCASVIEPRND